jgi:heme-degrading monooxygenase HmoA
MTLPPARFVTVSGIAVPEAGAAALEEAMQNRLGLVEGEPGFGGLQVWRPLRGGDPYRMVTWWTEEQAFRSYMRSEAHRASHARTPRGSDRPRPSGLDRYWCISD